MDKRNDVTPYAGVWIEIFVLFNLIIAHTVTPYAGVWIEIQDVLNCFDCIIVTPYAGVWIEISSVFNNACHAPSLPTRECGLK